MAKVKKKHKFNAVDAVIILLVAAIVAGVGYIFLSKRAGGSDKSFGIEYVIEIRTIRDEFSDNFSVGTKIIDSAAKYHIGEIVAVNVTPAIFTGTDLVNGGLVYPTYPEHSNVELTVKTTATLSSDGEYIIDDGYKLSVGTSVYIRTPDYIGMGYCTRLTETEER